MVEHYVHHVHDEEGIARRAGHDPDGGHVIALREVALYLLHRGVLCHRQEGIVVILGDRTEYLRPDLEVVVCVAEKSCHCLHVYDGDDV